MNFAHGGAGVGIGDDMEMLSPEEGLEAGQSRSSSFQKLNRFSASIKSGFNTGLSGAKTGI